MVDKVMKVSAIQQRHDTVDNWTTKNPVLLDGEQITVIFEDGSTRHKTGYGGKRYSELPFDGGESCEPSETVNATLLASAWVNGQQTISVPGLTKDHNGNVGLVHEVTSAQFEAAANAILYPCHQENGELTIAAYGDKPAIDIPVVVILLG